MGEIHDHPNIPGVSEEHDNAVALNHQSIDLGTVDRSFTVIVPIEMYQSIFRLVGNQGLTTLSQVSRTFQHEAEHILYEFVDLTFNVDRERAFSWCTSVTNVERRAQRVHTLRFPGHLPRIPFGAKLQKEDTQNIIAQAFNAIINLKHLFFLGQEDLPVTLYPSTLQNCTFQLASLAGQVASFTTEDQIQFLLKHPQIEYWVPTVPFLMSVNALPSNVLPRLRELVLVRPSLTRALRGRPLEALVLIFIDPTHTRTISLEAIIPLGVLGDTLHTLEYTHGLLDVDWSTVDILNSLSQRAPNLRTLSFTSFANSDPTITADNQQGLVDAVSKFHHLEILSLNTEMNALTSHNSDAPDPLNPLEHGATWEGRSPAQCRKIAALFMMACPSLRQLSFPVVSESKSGNGGSLAYVRSSGGGGNAARLDGFYRINTSGWWMR